uniref:Ecdysteroid kinase n=1 Tax=Musca domestica TaxID=7370 RepID=T1PI31_MUSDO
MSYYNDDELTAPDWINKQFLEEVLGNYENNGPLEVLKFDMSPASMKGDHYASAMFRCKVEYRFLDKQPAELKNISLIIKTLPVAEGMKREMLMESKVFETEIEMYTQALPKISKILAQCGEPTTLSAEIIYYSLSPNKVIIFQDLCELGYDTVRGRCLTEDEVKQVYTKLAKLHAVSYMLGHSETPDVVTKYQEGFMSLSMPMVKSLLANGLKNFINVLESHEELKIYVDKAKAMQNEIEPACKDLFNAYRLNKGQGDIFVLNHGDFHMKNLMFKFDAHNQMEDMIMVDFQISCYAPSVIDLLYSQFLILDTEMRLRRHEFMQYYFSEFLRILKKINYQGKLPKYSDFQISSLKYRHFVIYMVVVMLPMVVDFMGKSVEELKDTDINELLENPDVNALNYKLPVYAEELKRFLPQLLNEGYMD